jgi:signal transduction histidine kinase
MDFRQIRDELLPGPERDEKFREYLRRLSFGGLQTVAAVEIAVPVLMQAGRMAVSPESITAERLWQTAAMILVGGVTLGFSLLEWSRRHARLLAALSAFTAAVVLVWAAIWKPAELVSSDDYILTGITLVVLTAVATVPLRPWHGLTLGLAIESMYILSCWFAERWEISTIPGHSASHHIFLVLLAMLATGISATNYRHRTGEYEANQEAVRVAEALTGAQLRAELAENAISVGKMAAALSHELNSPLGALRSSIETLLDVADRQATAPEDQRERLAAMRAE